MKSTLRRTAVAGVLTSTAVVAGLLVAPSASAAIVSISPPGASNTETDRTITVTTSGSDTDYRFGGSVLLTNAAVPSATYTATIGPSLTPAAEKSPSATLDLTDTGNGLGLDGPLDAGDYRVTTTATGAPIVGTGAGTDTCATACFTVEPALPSQQVTVATVAPGSLRAGSAGDVTLSGDNFERRSRVEVLVPGGTTPDPAITVGAPLGTGSATDADSTQGITTRTSLKRRVTVASSAATGARDVRVTNLDGRTGTCVKCFSVNGAPLTGVAPSRGNNDPALGLTAVTFSGTGLNLAGRPALVFTADPGSSTRELLTLEGQNVRGASATSVTADFDLRNAAPQNYTPVVRNPDGSTNACECLFQVAPAQSTVTVTGVASDTATASTDRSQAAGTTKSFVVTGTGFAKGSRVTVSGAGVTTTAVQFLSPTALRATFQSTSGAATGNRNVTVTRTDAATGSCTACYTVTPTATPSATPTTTTSPTASPSASASPGTVQRPTIQVVPATIVAVQEKSAVIGNALPGSRIEIYAYSRPSTTYALVRSGLVGPDGSYRFEVGPSGNTRLYARTVTPQGSADSASIVLTVKTSLNLKVARTGTRTYRFTGSLLPKRPGQLITVFYEDGSGRRVIAARARNAADGTYNVSRTFSGTGTFTLFTGTGTDNNNAANNSNRVRVALR